MPEASGNHVLKILRVLSERGVEFVVCGGVAVVLHGVERTTLDVDVSVAMNPKNLQKFIGAMRELGLKPRAPVSPEILLDAGQVRTLIEEKHALAFTFLDPNRPYRQVDMLLTGAAAYERLQEQAAVIRIGELTVRVGRTVNRNEREGSAKARERRERYPRAAAAQPMKQSVQRSKDFDGHTEFAGLTPEQRLMWLSQAAQFVIAARQARPADAYEATPTTIESVRDNPSAYRLTNPEIRKLKAEGQHLEPVVRVGKSGLTPAVLQSIQQALGVRELIKIRFDHDRDERDALAGKVAEATGATLIMQVGKVAVYYRPRKESQDANAD